MVCKAVQASMHFYASLSFMEMSGKFTAIYLCGALSLHNCSSSGSLFFTTLRQNTKRYGLMTQNHLFIKDVKVLFCS